MTKHLAGSSLHSWPPPLLPHDLWYTSHQVGEALRSLDHELKETIRLETGKSFQSYINAYKDGMDKSTSTVLQHWEDLIKKWEDRLKTVDSLISNKLETIVREEAYRALSDEKRAFYNHLKATFNTLDAGKQELHQVVADSLTSYVSELQDTLERSNQALVLNQKHLEAVVLELQRLQQCRGNSNSGSNDNLAEERIDNTTNNITHSSHTPPYDTESDSNINNKNTTSVDKCTVEIGTTTPNCRTAELGTTEPTCLSTTTTTETATMSNTALAQLAQSTTQNSILAWKSAPRVPSVDTSPTPTANAAPTSTPTANAAPTNTPQGSGTPTPPRQAEHDADRREEYRDNFYRREDPQYHRQDHRPHDHYSTDYTRRDNYSPRSHYDTPRSYERERESYPPQYSTMAEKEKQKLSIVAQKWITGGTEGDFMGSFVHGVEKLSPLTLGKGLGIPDEAQMTIANMHLRLRNNTPYLTGALKFTKWPSLDVMQPAPFVEFYSLLGSSLLMFHIALMPFNGIQLEYEEHGLCIPGLGYAAYQEHSQALWSIIHTLLPTTRSDVKSHITGTRSSQDGYRLLWLVGSQVVKILSRLQSVPEPLWSDNDNVFSFSDTVEQYRILRRMRGQGLDDKEIGIKFLVGVRGKHQALAQSMAQQLSKVDVILQTLPLEWSLSSMANILNTTVTGSVIDEMRLTPARQQNQRRPYFRANYASDEVIEHVDYDDTSTFYSPTINATTNNRFSDSSQQRGQPRGQQRGQSRTDQQQRGDNGQRRRTPLFDGNCTACGHWSQNVPL